MDPFAVDAERVVGVAGQHKSQPFQQLDRGFVARIDIGHQMVRSVLGEGIGNHHRHRLLRRAFAPMVRVQDVAHFGQGAATRRADDLALKLDHEFRRSRAVLRQLAIQPVGRGGQVGMRQGGPIAHRRRLAHDLMQVSQIAAACFISAG